MGIIDSALGALGIGTESSQQQTAGTQKVDQTTDTTQQDLTKTTELAKTLTEQTQRGTQTSRQTGAQTGLQTQDVSTLDQATQALLQALTQQAGTVVGEGGLPALLTERARGADAAFDPTAIVERARTGVERDIGRRETALAGEAGSSLNSLVQQLGLEGRAKGEEMLAGLTAQLQQQARQAATSEITGAQQAGTQQLQVLVDALKGATTTGQVATKQATTGETVSESAQQLVTQQTAETTSEQEAIRTLQSIVNALTESTGTSSGTGYKDPLAAIAAAYAGT